MLLAPADYEPALHGPHRRVARIDAYDMDGNVLVLDVPVFGGQVSADLTNRVSRSADFELGPEFYPRTPTDPFSPYAAVVKIRAGIAHGNGMEVLFPVFTGRVYEARKEASGAVSFRADDLAADVIAYRFEQPQASSRVATATPVSEIQRLILEAVPQATFGTNDVSGGSVPDLVWDEDRGQALDDLAESMGCRWYTLGDGSFVVRRFLYTPSTPVQTFQDGPRGLMSQATTTITRDGTANSVVVVSERLDGTDPVRVVRRDTTAGSPTLFGGPFGKVTQVIKVQTPLTQNEANILASTQLTAAVALSEQWNANVVADYRLEPGDTVRLSYRGLMADQIIDRMTYPLGTQLMNLTTRGTVALDIPGA